MERNNDMREKKRDSFMTLFEPLEPAVPDIPVISNTSWGRGTVKPLWI